MFASADAVNDQNSTPLHDTQKSIVQSTAPTHPKNFHQCVQHARECCGPWPTHEIFPMLSTMSRHCKSSNCSPRALLEVKNAFNSVTGPSLISLLVSNLHHALHEKDDQEGDVARWPHFQLCLSPASLGVIQCFVDVIDSTDCELVCALLQLRLLFKWARGCMSLRHATEAEGRRGLARRLACTFSTF
jgi:hypothetical protein